jgi:ligand-binding SRPBCC domain-containing protein
MPKIELHTKINAPILICFDLARSIDLHKISTAKSNEEAIDGTISGIINLNETVTWQATHFGIKQKLTSKISAFESPIFFKDEQINGIFKYLKHEHHFNQEENHVLMTDIFIFESPFGIFGKIFNYLILKNYLKNLLATRNQIIKEYAESDKWKLVLKN